jgi:hypothetical protein
MAGLPRSGNTLISSILNQNPDIIVTPYSFMIESFYIFNEKFRYYEASKINHSYDFLIDNFLSNMLQVFYEPLQCKYVIDRCPDWGTKYNLNMLKKFVSEDVKLLCPVRNILEILASFIAKIHENEYNNYIDMQLIDDQIPIYRTMDDARCDQLMKPGGHIDSALHTLSQSKLPENKNNFHLIEYDNLIKNPKKEIKKIYEFLQIKYYDGHYYDNIKQYTFLGSRYNDSFLGLNLHEINGSIKKTAKPYQKILSKYIIEKYKNSETWK